MASIITATTSSGLTQSADNSGVLQLASGTGNLVTVPSVTGTAMVSGNMPAFSSIRATSDQSFSANTWTKMQFNSELFDTASCYDPTTNFRFTPNVAGYYLLTANPTIGVASAFNEYYVQVYKNGSGTNQYIIFSIPSGGLFNITGSIQALLYANGTTDYFEIYCYVNATSPAMKSSGGTFNGYLARAA